MANTVNTTFEDSSSNGRITLYANPFKNGSQYYGRFARNTVNTKNLIARIQKQKAGTNELVINQIAGFLKEAILEALSRGEAVNVLDLGTMYIVPNGKFNDTSFEVKNGEPYLSVRFTPSKLAQETVEKIQIKEVKVEQSGMEISAITDQFTGRTDGFLSAEKSVLIEGTKLKVAGDESGIFLCPITDTNEIVQDESQWISCPVVTRNTGKTVEFYLPSEAEKGKQYRILIKTFFAGGKSISRSPKTAESQIVHIE